MGYLKVYVSAASRRIFPVERFRNRRKRTLSYAPHPVKRQGAPDRNPSAPAWGNMHLASVARRRSLRWKDACAGTFRSAGTAAAARTVAHRPEWEAEVARREREVGGQAEGD